MLVLAGGGSDPDGDPLSYAWDLDNNGTFETPGQNPIFSAVTLDGPSTRTAVLQVTDGRGGAANSTATLNITNANPVPSLGEVPTTSPEGTSISLTGSVTDPGPDTHTYAWRVTKNSAPTAYATGTTKDFAFTPNDNGTYAVTLTVTDDDGGTGTATATLTVTNVSPIVEIEGASATPPEGSPISLKSQVADPGAQDTALAYAWRVTKNSAPTAYASGTTKDFAFTPNDNGTYVVTLIVTDKDGGSGTDQVTLNVTNVVPTVSITRAPETSPEGTPIALNGVAVDPGPLDTVLTYAWRVTKNGAPTPYATGTTKDFAFTPNDEGTYGVTLTVTDKDGGSGVDLRTIEVTDVAPLVTISGAPGASPEGKPINLTGTAIDPGPLDKLTLMWSVTRNGADYASGTGASFGFTPDDNGTYAVTLTATEEDGGAAGSKTVIIEVTNVAPAASVQGAPQRSPEGTRIALQSAVADPGTPDTHTYAWSVTRDGAAFGTGSGAGFSFTPDDDGTYGVTLTVTDRDGGAGTAQATITVTNAAPASGITGAPASSPEGTKISLTGEASDPGEADTHTFAWSVTKAAEDYASGTGETFSFTPDDDGTYAVTLTVTDDDGGKGAATATLKVENVKPTLEEADLKLSTPSVSEDGTVTLTGGFTDPGAGDTHAVEIQWGDGVEETLSLTRGARQFTATHRYLDDAPTGTPSDLYPIRVLVADDEEAEDEARTAVTVNNLAPQVAITGPAPGAVYLVNKPVSFTALVQDAGTRDTHSATWTFTNAPGAATGGESATGVVDPVTRAVKGSFTFPEPGVYAVQLDVEDDDAGSAVTDQVTVQGGTFPAYVVVVDPGDSSAFGGGWIESPKGAVSGLPRAFGKAQFNFHSRYGKNSPVPEGKVSFDLKAANLDFEGTAQQWLVVSGSRIQIQGVGTINRRGDYGFMLTAIAGGKKGRARDKFRIKIWSRVTGAILYDNQPGTGDLAELDDSTAVQGGNVVIH